ncbi:MAG: helix-turn-helix domain-containing protein, partial [Lachnospiraceae bacterium]|nr:helix-turn-helix domain-containing protein [Lachnospiraceae bacterium]
VKETAEKLFVHRNTINYYLGKIKELTGMDLSSLNVKTQLTTALMLMNIE